VLLEDITVPSGETELVVVWVEAPVTAPSAEVTVLVVVLVSEPEAQATSVLARATRTAAVADWTKVLRITGFLYSLRIFRTVYSGCPAFKI
jgi:hypothetical protein